MKHHIKKDYVYRVIDNESDEETISLCIAAGSIYFRDLRIVAKRYDAAYEGYVGFEWYFKSDSERYTPELIGHINDFPEYSI